ncbi:MAG: OmpA family protein [Phycisphaerales bacterium]|nr:OmpA family protein [Phycisphaerales bacterium]
MRAIVVFSLGSAVFLSTAGCVPQEKYDDMLNAYRSKEQQLHEAQSQIESLQSNDRMLREQLESANSDINRALGQLGSRDDDISRLRNDYEAMLDTVSGFDVGPLPPSLNEALVRLSSQHPGLLTYDEMTGMLRFASDLTFDLGSATLSTPGKQTLNQLAVILNSDDAVEFEVRVVGHTDNVPIRKPSTRAKHPTNLHLSAHRAIAVRNAMVSDGVSKGRLQIAGYGEYRPIAPNGEKGAAANRRVEIYLFPMPADAMAVESSETDTAPATQTATGSTDDEPLK